MAKLFTNGYSVLETNHVAAVKTGEIKAQYEMSAALALLGAQNGQLFTVDDVAKEVGLPTDSNALVQLHSSEEQIYDSVQGRNSFILQSPKLPKMLKLSVGDIFETNAIDAGAFQTLAAAKAGATVGVPHTTGDILIKATAAGTEQVILDIVEWVILPNGYQGVKFAVRRAGEVSVS